MLYVAAQIWFELLLAFVAGGVTMWWWQRPRHVARPSSSAHATQLPSPEPQVGTAPETPDPRPAPRPRPMEPSLPPSLVALAAEAEPVQDPGPTARKPGPTSPGPAPSHPGKGAPTGVEDDLTRIRGVGPVLQRRLHELGVHSLEEIAAWTPEDVERVQSHLAGFPDRIRRDRWVDQARDLLSETP